MRLRLFLYVRATTRGRPMLTNSMIAPICLSVRAALNACATPNPALTSVTMRALVALVMSASDGWCAVGIDGFARRFRVDGGERWGIFVPEVALDHVTLDGTFFVREAGEELRRQRHRSLRW